VPGSRPSSSVLARTVESARVHELVGLGLPRSSSNEVGQWDAGTPEGSLGARCGRARSGASERGRDLKLRPTLLRRPAVPPAHFNRVDQFDVVVLLPSACAMDANANDVDDNLKGRRPSTTAINLVPGHPSLRQCQ
jgi:hypothetical protein